MWGIARAAPCDADASPALLANDGGCAVYARSSIRGRIDGVDATGVHESLSLKRLTSPAVRLMLPFKMLRRGSATNGGVR